MIVSLIGRGRPTMRGPRSHAFSHSPKGRGRIAVNICERGGRLYAADRAGKVWTEVELDAVRSVASSEMRLALEMALWTGQRQGDLLRLTWAACDGDTVRLRQ